MTVDDTSQGLVQELRARGIANERVLAAIGVIPRDRFVDPVQSGSAYHDKALPIACGQTISQPYVVAYMTEKLALEPRHEVLEVGTGSGYQAAILSRLARHVYTIERHEALLVGAAERFRALGIGNITAIVGDGADGWPDARTFDRIIVTAAAREAPPALLAQLAEGGRMIIPLGSRLFHQRLVQFDREEDAVRRTDLIGVRFVPLIAGQA